MVNNKKNWPWNEAVWYQLFAWSRYAATMVTKVVRFLSTFDLILFFALPGRWREHASFNSQGNFDGSGADSCSQRHLPVANVHLPALEKSLHCLCQVPHECQTGEISFPLPSLFPLSTIPLSINWHLTSPPSSIKKSLSVGKGRYGLCTQILPSLHKRAPHPGFVPHYITF